MSESRALRVVALSATLSVGILVALLVYSLTGVRQVCFVRLEAAHELMQSLKTYQDVMGVDDLDQ